MTLRGRFLGSEFRWVCCWLTSMKAEAGVWATALWKVPITARLLRCPSSCTQLLFHCYSFCCTPFLGCKGLCFARSFARVALVVGRRTLFLPAGERKFQKAAVYQNLEAKCDHRTSWGGNDFERSCFALSSFGLYCCCTSLARSRSKVVATTRTPHHGKRGSICTRYCPCFNCNARRYLN